ncbi:hypothetical protein GF318_01075 [Candidatus Micrarchaeota archaeon]|nr:hypothetical protein [Candidatus Micrarchaeota archaeon]
MNMKHVLLLLVLFSASFAGLSVTSTSVSQESFKPGTNGVVTLVVANTEAATKAITGVNMEVDSPPQITISGEIFIGDLEPGGSTTVSLPFKVDKDAKSAIYTVRVDISGVSDKPMGGYEVFTRRLSFPITVVHAPVFGLSAEEKVLNGIEQINLNISNSGGTANNVRIRIPGDSEIALYGRNEIFISSLGENSTVVPVSLDSRNAEDGPVDVPFKIEYEDEIGIHHIDETFLRMTVRNEKLDLQILQASDIRTRSTDTLTLEVTNEGSERLEDVTLMFSNGSIKITEKEEYDFGDIGPGESSTVSLSVFTELPAGVNLVDAELEWIERDVQKSTSRMVPVTVTSDADVGVFLEAKPLPLIVGQEHTISVLVSNLGSFNIENVDVQFSSPALKSIDISDQQYIGGLQRDDFSTVQFQMEVNATGPGTYPAHITVNYRDQSGGWKQKTLKQDISIYNGTQEESSSIPYVAGSIVVVGALLLWYFRLRKPSKK